MAQEGYRHAIVLQAEDTPRAAPGPERTVSLGESLRCLVGLHSRRAWTYWRRESTPKVEELTICRLCPLCGVSKRVLQEYVPTGFSPPGPWGKLP